jgi:catechol 2,3-dioxygenase-like lactoylglutathione lyase family enzyme
MNAEEAQPPVLRFGRIAPMVPVTSIGRALDFYCGVLGFEKVFENGTPVGFVILERDAAELHLTLDPRHEASNENVAHLMVSDAAALYELCSGKGVRIVKGLRDADFGLRCFVFADPDGNCFDVGQPI